MSSWMGELDEEGRESWDDFVEHFRKEAVQMIAGSAACGSIVPSDEAGDVKFWAELGCMIMLDKPIIALVFPGTTVPRKMRLVADVVVEADVDTEEGRQLFADAIAEFMDER